MIASRPVAWLFAAALCLMTCHLAWGASAMAYARHDVYQAVNSDGSSAYSGGFPVVFRGVVLNNTEDWLDPTPACDTGVTLWDMGGEAEFYLQAVDLPGDAWDDGDVGGTSVWIGQNYGNHIMHQDPIFNYTDAQWQAELDRLGLFGGPNVATPLRAGMLVEVTARAGLFYKGKMNVNEAHDNDYDRTDSWDGFGSPGDGESHDFEITVLDADYGLPVAAAVSVGTFKDASNEFVFDANRATGGERYQSTRVKLTSVRITNPDDWGAESELIVEDRDGRTFPVVLCRNAGFDATTAPGGWVNVVGIVDQSDPSGQGGYRLLVMNAADVAWQPGDADADGVVGLTDLSTLAGHYGRCDSTWAQGDFDDNGCVGLTDLSILAGHYGFGADAVPEPACLALLAMGALAAGRRRR